MPITKKSIQSGYTNEVLVDLVRNSSGEEQSNFLLMLYNQNYGIIHMIAKKYAAFEDIEDLEQQAFFALWIALNRYDPAEGSFVHYAAIWIKQTIMQYLEECGCGIRLPRHTRNQLFQYNKVVEKYRNEIGRDPTDDDVMRELQISSNQLKGLKASAAMAYMTSLDKVISADNDSFTLGDTVADSEDLIAKIDDQIDDEIRKDDLWSEVDLLGAEYAEIIKRRFQSQETLQAIGESLGMSNERVRQIQNNGLRRLRQSVKVKMYRDDYYAAMAYSGTGFGAFRTSGSSATERTAIKHYNENIEGHMRRLEREIRKIEQKYGIVLDEQFRKEQMQKYLSRGSMV